ncbi:MAG: ABC transporter ATP-binding protein [Alphaproteobacteria bacterium]|nr:ABC transporter ATP-binding protein [Alphaproteobacteria bacterium]
MAEQDLLRLRGLRVAADRKVLVDGMSLDLRPGHITALVGRSGSGKTLTARALLGLVGCTPGVVAGSLEITVDGKLHRPYASTDPRARERAFRPLRGAVVGYLPQDTQASLDPLRRVGAQVTLALRLAGRPLDPVPWLQKAGLPNAAAVARLHPHELSGGMAQRVVIAQALARGSRYLLADEPTTGLDPTHQDALLDELCALRDQGVGVLFITHDLRLVPRVADRLLVMHGGRLLEDLPARAMDQLTSPQALALVDATTRIAGGVL